MSQNKFAGFCQLDSVSNLTTDKHVHYWNMTKVLSSICRFCQHGYSVRDHPRPCYESWRSGGNWVLSSWTTSAQCRFKPDYIWVTCCLDKQGIETHKLTDNLQDWLLTISIFLRVFRPGWMFGHKFSDTICIRWHQYSPWRNWIDQEVS